MPTEKTQQGKLHHISSICPRNCEQYAGKERLHPTLASRASVILGPEQVFSPKMDPRLERTTDSCKDPDAYFMTA